MVGLVTNGGELLKERATGRFDVASILSDTVGKPRLGGAFTREIPMRPTVRTPGIGCSPLTTSKKLNRFVLFRSSIEAKHPGFPCGSIKIANEDPFLRFLARLSHIRDAKRA